MTSTDAGQGVVVNIGECRCPGAPRPHPDGDTVTLVPRLTLPMAASLKTRMLSADLGDDSIAAVQFSLVSGYLRAAPFGAILSWSFLEEGPELKGQPTFEPVPITSENVERLLPWANGGEEVAETADRLYGADFLAPFLRRINTSSNTGRTGTSTSATTSSSRPRRSPAKRSSPPASVGLKPRR